MIIEDVDGVLAVSDPELDRFLSGEDLLRFLEDPDVVCLVAEDDGIIGFIVGAVIAPRSEPRWVGLPDCEDRKNLLRNISIGFIDAVAVASSAKGRGVGTALVERCLAMFSGRGCTEACAMAWKSPHGTNVAGVLRRCGFAEGIEIPNYWTGMYPGIGCKYCGVPCRCSGVYWHRSISASTAPSPRCPCTLPRDLPR